MTITGRRRRHRRPARRRPRSPTPRRQRARRRDDHGRACRQDGKPGDGAERVHVRRRQLRTATGSTRPIPTRSSSSCKAVARASTPNTCAFDSGTYKATGPGDDPNCDHDAASSTSPTRAIRLADYSFVFAPYCTGDVHLGTATHVYGPELDGAAQGLRQRLDRAERHSPRSSPTRQQVVVTGESAGSVPTPLYGGLAHDLLPNAQIEVLADGSGAYPDVPAVTARHRRVVGNRRCHARRGRRTTADRRDWSLHGLFMQANKHDPDIIFGRHDYAFDAVQTIVPRSSPGFRRTTSCR